MESSVLRLHVVHGLPQYLRPPACQQVPGDDVRDMHLFLHICIITRNLLLETWPLGLEKNHQWSLLSLIQTEPPPMARETKRGFLPPLSPAWGTDTQLCTSQKPGAGTSLPSPFPSHKLLSPLPETKTPRKQEGDRLQGAAHRVVGRESPGRVLVCGAELRRPWEPWTEGCFLSAPGVGGTTSNVDPQG